PGTARLLSVGVVGSLSGGVPAAAGGGGAGQFGGCQPARASAHRPNPAGSAAGPRPASAAGDGFSPRRPRRTRDGLRHRLPRPLPRQFAVGAAPRLAHAAIAADGPASADLSRPAADGDSAGVGTDDALNGYRLSAVGQNKGR